MDGIVPQFEMEDGMDLPVGVSALGRGGGESNSNNSFSDDSGSYSGSQSSSPTRPLGTSTPINNRRRRPESQDWSEQVLNLNSEEVDNSKSLYGTLVPNRIFVGGISCQTTEDELKQLFSQFGAVCGTKIILDRAGVSKGYGFITFETDEEANRLCYSTVEPIIHRDRRLNIAPAIKKQPTARPEFPVTAPTDCPHPPAHYNGTSLYYPPPTTEHFYAPTTASFCPGPLASAAPIPSYYSAPGPATPGSVCYLPHPLFPQFSQPAPCPNNWTNSVPAPPGGQFQWRWTSPDVPPPPPFMAPPSAFPNNLMHSQCPSSNSQVNQPSYQRFPNPGAGSSFSTSDPGFFINSYAGPQAH